MAKTDNGIKTSNEFLNALHSGGWRWVNDDYSTGPVEIKYYFAPAGINLDNEFAAIDANGYGTSQEWTEEQKWAFKVALQQWKNVADITFTEVFSEGEADFVEYAGDKPNGILGAHLAPWHGVGKGVYAFGSDEMADSTLQMGGFGFETLLHEIGHGLGLQHPFEGVLFPGVEDGDGYSAGDDGWNQTIFTVMSYNSGWDELGNPPRDYGQAAGPSAFDIAAIQDLYGANTTYNSDDNVYHLGHYDFQPDGHVTIWDTGGTDLIIYNGSYDATIDLRPATLKPENGGGGFVTYVHGAPESSLDHWNTFTIAADVTDALPDENGEMGVIIEKATGGGGNDLITGNNADNVLLGRGGNDIIEGGGGNDTIDGGSGTDTAEYSGVYSDFNVTGYNDDGSIEYTHRAGGDQGSDTLSNIERITHSGGGVWEVQLGTTDGEILTSSLSEWDIIN